MRKVFIISICVFVLLAGCGFGGNDVSFEKQLFIDAKAMEKEGKIPSAVFYDEQSQKFAVEFRDKKNKKLLRFYDSTQSDSLSHETLLADDIFRPYFNLDSFLYGLFIGGKWKVFIKNLAGKEAAKMLATVDFLAGYSSNSAIAAKMDGKYSVLPSSLGYNNFDTIEDFSSTWDGQLVFKALKQGGSQWIVVNKGKEEGPYTYVSKIALSKDGEVAYIAREGDKEDQWFIVVEGRKISLDTQYQEIGRIFIEDGDVVFSAMEKGKNSWSIYKNERVLVDKLAVFPVFALKDNGKLIYTLDEDKGIQYVVGNFNSSYFTQVEQLLEDNYGNVFAKIKNQYGLWQAVTEDQKSDQYVWMSDMFVDSKGDVFFFGVTSRGDMEFAKFRNK